MGEAALKNAHHFSDISEFYDYFDKNLEDSQNNCEWFEEFLEADLKWSIALNSCGVLNPNPKPPNATSVYKRMAEKIKINYCSVLHRGTSRYQDIAVLEAKHFGKVLVIDGKLQSAERDEFVYHECLIHPALLIHDNPKTVFIMGGGDGSAARETLRHKGIEKVFICDIDQEVVDFCRKYLTANQRLFCDKRLHLVINDAKAHLEKRKEKFDVIIGDLGDPIEGGPCNHLYTKSFYQRVVKPKLNDRGIFVTQAGPAGILTHKEVFSSIYNTIKHVFKYVIAYTAHVPSYADTRGWIMASDHLLELDVEQIDHRVDERITGELRYLDGASFISSTIMNKTLFSSLLNETHIYTEENARFIHGHGMPFRDVI